MTHTHTRQSSRARRLGIGLAVAAAIGVWATPSARAQEPQSCDPENPPTIEIGTPESQIFPDSYGVSDPIRGANTVSQTLKVPGAGCFAISEITIRVRRNSSPGDLVVSIQAAAIHPGHGMVAVGAPLGSASISAADIPTDEFVTQTVIFDPPVQVAGGTYIAVVLSAEGTGGRYYEVGLEYGTTYSEAGYPQNLHYCKKEACPNSGGLEAEEGRDITMRITYVCCDQGCVLTQGYWKNHGGDHPARNPQPNAWPEDVILNGLDLGGVNYSQVDLLSILRTEVRGNGLIALAHQLIAAKLNAANDAAVPPAVQMAMDNADALIESWSGTMTLLSGAWAPTSATSGLTATLDLYNNGEWPGGPPHCDDEESGITELHSLPGFETDGLGAVLSTESDPIRLEPPRTCVRA